ncbi:MAG TPA: hypothetical protein VK072_02450 [Candidatus Avamphibacillus sp.]|nr:hypothetical protein [Candidatus Avamphibacillus sp.]
MLTVPFVFLVLYVASFNIVPILYKANTNKFISNAIMISHAPLILIPILVNGVNTAPYKGIFYNPNSFGSILATLFAVLLAPFLYTIGGLLKGFNSFTNVKIKLIVQGLILFLISFLVILSGSRTSSLAVVGMVMIGLLFLIIDLIKEKKINALITKGTFLFLAITSTIIVLIKLTPFYDYLYINILYKFEVKASSGDVLDNRGAVWSESMQQAGLFGRGKDFFTEEIGVGAHNTFISIMGEYGWIPLIPFILFLIFSFTSSIKYFLKASNNQYRYFPLLMVSCFLLLSLGEGMLFKLSMIAMFFAIGSTVNLKNKTQHIH